MEEVVPSDSKLLTIFLPNAGTVLLILEHLGSSKPVTCDTSRDARVALGAAFNMNMTRGCNRTIFWYSLLFR